MAGGGDKTRSGKFGPWMLVTKLGRRSRDRRQILNGKEGKGGVNRGKKFDGGSRFSILEDMGDSIEGEDVMEIMGNNAVKDVEKDTTRKRLRKGWM
ncbi:hypothetical protein CDL15_Pgr024682 [Punica granatum]|uniref:Uncharacterized protein n=1 Tax=Punica granatum TaxID=22663 RepID=A0A218W416_PUNGR|nr:hypothetical protein CDL15_Pgr024682 [Punica granatum]